MDQWFLSWIQLSDLSKMVDYYVSHAQIPGFYVDQILLNVFISMGLQERKFMISTKMRWEYCCIPLAQQQVEIVSILYPWWACKQIFMSGYLLGYLLGKKSVEKAEQRSETFTIASFVEIINTRLTSSLRKMDLFQREHSAVA